MIESIGLQRNFVMRGMRSALRKANVLAVLFLTYIIFAVRSSASDSISDGKLPALPPEDVFRVSEELGGGLNICTAIQIKKIKFLIPDSATYFADTWSPYTLSI